MCALIFISSYCLRNKKLKTRHFKQLNLISLQLHEELARPFARCWTEPKQKIVLVALCISDHGGGQDFLPFLSKTTNLQQREWISVCDLPTLTPLPLSWRSRQSTSLSRSSFSSTLWGSAPGVTTPSPENPRPAWLTCCLCSSWAWRASPLCLGEMKHPTFAQPPTLQTKTASPRLHLFAVLCSCFSATWNTSVCYLAGLAITL